MTENLKSIQKIYSMARLLSKNDSQVPYVCPKNAIEA